MKQYQQVCVGGFIQNDKGGVLMVKRSDTDDFLPGLWELPGGGTDIGENPIQALQREIKEEVGLDVVVERPLSVDDYTMEEGDSKIHRVEITFLCNATTETVVLSHEHSEYKWVMEENIKSLGLTEYMAKAVMTCFKSL